MFNKPCHTYTRGMCFAPQPSGRQQQQPIWAAFATDIGRGTGRGTGRVACRALKAPKQHSKAVRMWQLKCRLCKPLAWPALVWTAGPQDVHVFGYTAKPIIFSCYICISKKSNGTNPNSCTKDKQKFKKTCVHICVWVTHSEFATSPSHHLHCVCAVCRCVCVCVCVLGPWKYCSLSAMATFLAIIVGFGWARVCELQKLIWYFIVLSFLSTLTAY